MGVGRYLVFVAILGWDAAPTKHEVHYTIV